MGRPFAVLSLAVAMLGLDGAARAEPPSPEPPPQAGATAAAGGEPLAAEQQGSTAGEATEAYELEEIVVSAGRNARTLLDSALPVSRVTAEQLREASALSVGDSIRALPGVSLYNHGGIYFQNPSIRGMSGRRVIMLLNGDRINSEMTMGVTGFFLNLEDVERIEVVRGPASVLWGTDGLGGAVNVITRDPYATSGLSGRISSTAGTNNLELSNALSASYAADTWFVGLSGRMRDADDYAAGDGQLVENSNFHDRNARLVAGVRFGHHRLSLEGMNHWGVDVGKAVTPDDDEKHRRICFPTDDTRRVSLRYSAEELSPLVRRLQASAFLQDSERLNRAEVFRDPGNWSEVSSRVDKATEVLHGGLQGHTVLRLGERHLVSAGLEASAKSVSIYSDAITYLPAPLGPFSSPRIWDFDGARQVNLGLFAEDEWFLADRLKALSGLRFDLLHSRHQPTAAEGEAAPSAVENDASSWSGNLGLVLSTSEHSRLTLNVGRAFRAPTIHETMLTTTTCLGVYCGALELRPETSFNLDLGFKAEAAPLTFEAYAFNAWVRDLIVPARQPSTSECDYLYVNNARSMLTGGEARVALSFRDVWWPGLSVLPSASTSFVRGEDRVSGEPLPTIPPWQLRGAVRIERSFGSWVESGYLHLGLEYHHRQDRVAAHVDESGTRVEDELRTDGYALVSGRLGADLRGFWSFTRGQLNLVVANALNQSFRDHLSATHGIGREVKLTLALEI